MNSSVRATKRSLRPWYDPTGKAHKMVSRITKYNLCCLVQQVSLLKVTKYGSEQPHISKAHLHKLIKKAIKG